MIRKEVVEKLTEEDWNRIVKIALSYLPDADDEQKNNLNTSLENARVHIPGFRKPILAPIGSLSKPILENIDNQDVKESIAVMWMNSQSQLRDEILEYLEEKRLDDEPDGKKVIKEARAFLKKINNPDLKEVALGISILTCNEVDFVTEEEPNEKESDGSKSSGSKLKKALEKEKSKNQRLEEKNTYLQERLEKFQIDIERLNAESERVSNKIKDLKSKTDEVVADKINEWSKSLLMEFADNKEKEKIKSVADDLKSLEKLGRSAIKDQKEKNRRYGTIKGLREKYHRILNLLEELRFLKDQSIYVVPGVDNAINVLQGRLQTMESDPEIQTIIRSDIDRSFRVDIGRIADLEVSKSVIPEIELISNAASMMRDGGLLTDEDHHTLEQILCSKLEKIVLAQGVPACLSKKEDTFDKKVNSGAYKDKTLVIDGNNIILEVFFRDTMDKVPEFSCKRDDFNRKVKDLAGQFAKVFVVYDGICSEDRHISRNMMVIFTDNENAGIEADDKIIEILSKLGDSKAIVATSDRGLIDRCEAKTCMFVRAKDCYEFFCG